MISSTLSTTAPTTRVYTTIDCECRMEYVTKAEEQAVEHCPRLQHGDAYRALRELAEEFRITKTSSIHSKKWCMRDISQQLQNTRAGEGTAYERQAAILKAMIKSQKKQCCDLFLKAQGHRHPCDVIRIAKDYFKMTTTMGDITDANGVVHSTDSHKVAAFTLHHLIYSTPYRTMTTDGRGRQCPLVDERKFNEILAAQRKCQNASSTGPDGTSYRLLNLIRNTRLSCVVLEEVSCTIPQVIFIRTTRA